MLLRFTLSYGSCLYRQGSCLGYCALPCLWFMSLQARELLGLLRFTLSMGHVFTSKGASLVTALHLVYGSCLTCKGAAWVIALYLVCGSCLTGKGAAWVIALYLVYGSCL